MHELKNGRVLVIRKAGGEERDGTGEAQHSKKKCLQE